MQPSVYEECFLGDELRNETFRGHKVAVWNEVDLKDPSPLHPPISEQSGQLADHRQASSLEDDGTIWIEALSYSGDYDLFQFGVSYYSFQVSNWYHDLDVAHYLVGEDYTSESSNTGELQE